jgi:hypothetical protein
VAFYTAESESWVWNVGSTRCKVVYWTGSHFRCPFFSPGKWTAFHGTSGSDMCRYTPFPVAFSSDRDSDEHDGKL